MTAPNPLITPEMQDALRKVDFGLQVQQFLKTRIGKYLLERAAEEVEEKTQALKTHDILGNPNGAARLQAEIWRAESFMYWLAEAVTAGADITQQLIAEERQARGDDEGSQSGDATGN